MSIKKITVSNDIYPMRANATDCVAFVRLRRGLRAAISKRITQTKQLIKMMENSRNHLDRYSLSFDIEQNQEIINILWSQYKTVRSDIVSIKKERLN